MIYEVGQKFVFNGLLPEFSFKLSKKENENLFLTVDSDWVYGRISTMELDKALAENKIYLDGTSDTNTKHIPNEIRP